MTNIVKKRIVDPRLLRWVIHERDGGCLYGFYEGGQCQFGFDPHHIVPRSMGGDDVSENIITLCRKHHDMAEERLIPRELLQEIVERHIGDLKCLNTDLAP